MKASCSMFSQIVKLVPRLEFEKLVRDTGAERAAKGLSSWSQVVAMMFCQLRRAHWGSRRRRGLRCPANRHRPWQLYEQVFYQLLDRIYFHSIFLTLP